MYIQTRVFSDASAEITVLENQKPAYTSSRVTIGNLDQEYLKLVKYLIPQVKDEHLEEVTEVLATLAQDLANALVDLERNMLDKEEVSEGFAPQDVAYPDPVYHEDKIQQVLHTHQTNACNSTISITVVDEPGDGGANHFYLVENLGYKNNPSWDGRDVQSTAVVFQNGPVPEYGTNGFTHEVLLAILKHRLEGFQNGKFACIENQIALNHINAALETLKSRTKNRVKRGVEGTHNK